MATLFTSLTSLTSFLPKFLFRVLIAKLTNFFYSLISRRGGGGGWGRCHSTWVCFGRKTKFFRESEDFCRESRHLEIFLGEMK